MSHARRNGPDGRGEPAWVGRIDRVLERETRLAEQYRRRSLELQRQAAAESEKQWEKTRLLLAAAHRDAEEDRRKAEQDRKRAEEDRRRWEARLEKWDEERRQDREIHLRLVDVLERIAGTFSLMGDGRGSSTTTPGNGGEGGPPKPR